MGSVNSGEVPRRESRSEVHLFYRHQNLTNIWRNSFFFVQLHKHSCFWIDSVVFVCVWFWRPNQIASVSKSSSDPAPQLEIQLGSSSAARSPARIQLRSSNSSFRFAHPAEAYPEHPSSHHFRPSRPSANTRLGHLELNPLIGSIATCPDQMASGVLADFARCSSDFSVYRINGLRFAIPAGAHPHC